MHLNYCLQRSSQLISDMWDLNRKKEDIRDGPYKTKWLETQHRDDSIGNVSGEAGSRTDWLAGWLAGWLV